MNDMPLPVLSTSPAADPLRAFLRTERSLADQQGEVVQLDSGIAIRNPEMHPLPQANRVFAASMPPGESPDAVLAEIAAAFESATPCLQIDLDPTAPPERTQPLAAALQSQNWQLVRRPIFARTAAAPRATAPAGVMIIPTRSAYRQATELAARIAAEADRPMLSELELAALDDPHIDSLIALRNGEPLGCVSVLAAGDIGRITALHIAPSHRRTGLGQLLLARSLEICSRSVFKQVVAELPPNSTPAKELFTRFGFREAGEVDSWMR